MKFVEEEKENHKPLIKDEYKKIGKTYSDKAEMSLKQEIFEDAIKESKKFKFILAFTYTTIGIMLITFIVTNIILGRI